MNDHCKAPMPYNYLIQNNLMTNQFLGIGNELRHYFLDDNGITTTSTLINRLTDKIHGIYAVPFDLDCFKIILYGGKEFAMVNLIRVRIIPSEH